MGVLQQASLIVTPNAYKAGKLYSVVPSDGTGDLDVIRATSATRVNSLGLIESVGINVPRIDYTSASCPSILVEPQRTNLIFPSANLTTQTITVTSVAHTLSFYGTGSVTLSGAATDTLNGVGVNDRAILIFTPIAGSLILTVVGSVTMGQLEIGGNATSYIPTTTTTVTRNVDIISKTGATNLIGQTEGTLLIKGFQLARGLIFRISNNLSTANQIFMFCSSTEGILEYTVRKNGVNISNSVNLFPNTQKNKNIVIKYSPILIKVFINGVLFWNYNYSIETNFTSILDKIDFGSISEQAMHRTTLVALWKTQITDAEAIQLTTL